MERSEKNKYSMTKRVSKFSARGYRQQLKCPKIFPLLSARVLHSNVRESKIVLDSDSIPWFPDSRH